MGKVVVSDEVGALSTLSGSWTAENEEDGYFFGREGWGWFWGRREFGSRRGHVWWFGMLEMSLC